MKLKLFHIPKPRRFNYQPVFYDEVKERRKERERKIREELGMPPMEGDENRTPEQRIRGQFTSTYSKDIEFSRRAKRTSNTRIVVIAAIIIMLIYFMLGSRLERLFSFF